MMNKTIRALLTVTVMALVIGFGFLTCEIIDIVNHIKGGNENNYVGGNESGGNENNDDDSDESEGNWKYPKELWGEWIGSVAGNEALTSNSGKTWYITQDSITIGGRDINSVIFTMLPLPTYGQSYQVSLKSISYNVAEAVVSLGNGSCKFILLSSRTKKSVFTGKIVGETGRSADRAVGGLGSIQVTIVNLKNAADKTDVTTDNDGVYSVPETIVQDEFSLTANGTTTTVIPGFDNVDVGTLTVDSGLNVKVRVKGSDNANLMQLYNRGVKVNDETVTSYKLTFIFENCGTRTAYNVSCNYTCDDGLKFNGAATGTLTLGSIGDKVTQNLAVECARLSQDYEIKKINFTFNSGTYSWEDSISLRFNKEPVRITFMNRAGGPLIGMILSPAGVSIPIETKATNILYPDNYSWSIYADLPKWKNADYLIVIIGVYRGNYSGSHYSVGFGEEPPNGTVGWATLPNDQLDADEPNDTEETAKLKEIKFPGSFVSYIRSGNLDYFKVRITD